MDGSIGRSASDFRFDWLRWSSFFPSFRFVVDELVV